MRRFDPQLILLSKDKTIDYYCSGTVVNERLNEHVISSPLFETCRRNFRAAHHLSGDKEIERNIFENFDFVHLMARSCVRIDTDWIHGRKAGRDRSQEYLHLHRYHSVCFIPTWTQNTNVVPPPPGAHEPVHLLTRATTPTSYYSTRPLLKVNFKRYTYLA